MESRTPDSVDDLERRRYPIGRFAPRKGLAPAELGELIDRIERLPRELEAAVERLSTAQLDTPYRERGWTVRQVVHHIADSHMNSYIRFKLAMTEHEPAIKSYDENAWSDLPDARDGDVGVSLRLLAALHERWAAHLRTLAPEDFQRTFRHPELGQVTLESSLQLYAWHGQHHTAHIVEGGKRMGWRDGA